MKKKTKKYICLEISGIFLGLLGRVCKSILFNFIVFIIGFGSGYMYITTKVHYYAINNEKYECIIDLQNKLNEQRILDDSIDEEIKELKMRIAHENNCELDNFPGNIILKNIKHVK